MIFSLCQIPSIERTGLLDIEGDLRQLYIPHNYKYKAVQTVEFMLRSGSS